jgi:glutamate-1-semialdehyde-2,1-aminomutase
MITAIIQARMGSTRLPGKSLMKIQGKSLIWYVINRVRQSKYVEQVVLATSEKPENRPLMKEAEAAGAKAFAGDENDVLDRFYKAAKNYNAKSSDILVRITGDCPLIDPEIIDNIIDFYKKGTYDYVHRGLSFPDGIGECEVFSFKLLEEAWKKTVGSDREHVTPYFWRNSSLFKIGTYENEKDMSAYNLSVDEKNQFKAVKMIFDALYDRKKNNLFHMKEIIEYVEMNPMVYKLTKDIERSTAEQIVKQQTKKKYARSAMLLARAKQLTPCAAQTYSKCYRYYCEGAAPTFMERGKGSHVWDVDGNKYIDFVGALGAITVGYCNPEVDEAIKEQLKKGIAFSQATPLEVELAEKLAKIIPSAEMVRFVKNGSDATSAAVRLARAYTGKEIIAASGYHGYQDWYIGSTENDLGVPEAFKKLIKLFEYNNIESVKKIFEDNKGKVAAVILEPMQEDGPKDDFLAKLKKIANDNGALLIFDEVVTGFRLGLAGAQGLFKVVPDITALGKGMGNGLPISAVVGKAEIMKLIEEGAFISTTHGGEALSLAGSIATIRILERKGSYEKMTALGKSLKSGFEKIIKDNKLEAIVGTRGLPVHFSPTFKPTKTLTSHDLLSVFQQTMINEGILVLTTNTLCLAHTKDDIDKYLLAAKKAIAMVRLAVDKDSVKDILIGEKFRPIFKRNKDR